MNNITLQDLIDRLKDYNPDEIDRVTRAYHYAEKLHRGQKRQSGEDYITHPLNVAYILTEMHADGDTLCAALLHDVLEDTKTLKEEIIRDFNEDVANLVDGVTKLSKMNFSSKQDEKVANTRKIITSLTEDVRIIIIKLADRLHNMRTLQFKTEFKQQENAVETMEIFVPLAYYLGAYRIKSELEDLSLQYLKKTTYKEFSKMKKEIDDNNIKCLLEMKKEIEKILNDKDINHEIKVRTKNIYGIYKKLDDGQKLSDIHDLLSLKIMVPKVEDCYYVLYLIHKKYRPINNKFKDYICIPKTNMYQSLHTIVFGPDERLVQIQIRTFDMDKVASFGLTAYWEVHKGKARYKMQETLKDKFQFFKSLTEINSMFGDNQKFIDQVKCELFADKIYVYTSKGEILELPKGSTVIDFAYKIHTDIGNMMVGAFVNEEYVPIDTILKSKDRVRIVTDDLSTGPTLEWLDKVNTSYSRRRIREFLKD